MRAIVGILVVATVLLAAGSASAISTSQKLHRSSTVVAWYEGKGHWTLRPHYRKCAQLRSDSAAARCYRHRQNYRWHRSRIRRLAPPALPVLGHLAGWLCIHAREGAWDSQTGNGYYGGLQMSYGWMGLVGNAALLSPAAQMAAAESGFAASGYSTGWLAGQWPNTYPPCAGYF